MNRKLKAVLQDAVPALITAACVVLLTMLLAQARAATVTPTPSPGAAEPPTVQQLRHDTGSQS